ncbi:hypothetical protein A3B45_01615 [Candidatus Daviesbacteria bacterium RIFCSPLOWO2_01_FULL_39_12]|uniref:GIY-YIG domain-containing protein n=1 Tax=Candidatus Daviesbacteria bacterium RIFCSPLOWO2_01_FULL_39_12 TaxID=1797785 RepID=A0A1F5KNN9_9BACT|nr:MAG: hypothetical protein A3D79_02785 [Candidatus Daviesbacteria bacterium RIFCSPHIGHO2_02_FULL_39_8]OGE42480.1 MAG: hypothetical protein A3B45_01615 [Candidatus Daviesbacteria bacterium RIFCSPLOWO2_01_FULL_39_12]
MYYVYVLRSLKTGEFYKGLTANLNQRLKAHLGGKTKSTKIRLPVELMHVEICETRTEARKLEKYFKSGFGRELIEEIAQN